VKESGLYPAFFHNVINSAPTRGVDLKKYDTLPQKLGFFGRILI